ncbi:hypothetical protein GGI07_003841 [Coemansia sp. Benny D115]|nr:hypothetical protein GGI07_003841 [Coemansia sp. Benny D115]
MDTSAAPDAGDSGDYEVERIIGRRITLGKTEHFIFWKGYTMADCTWEDISDNASCGEVLADFEMRCTEQRIERLSNQSVPQIDRYENEGVATLIDEALKLIPTTESAFNDGMKDFAFASGEVVGEQPAAEKKRQAQKAPRREAATLGWNRRVKAAGLDAPEINGIAGSISTHSGRVYYLTQWSDGHLTWEVPRAFDAALNVLTRYENVRLANKRRELLMQFRRAKNEGDPSLVKSPPGKSNMERKRAHRVADARNGVHELLEADTGLGGLLDAPLFDLGTSNLLSTSTTQPQPAPGAREEPPATKVRSPAASAAEPAPSSTGASAPPKPKPSMPQAPLSMPEAARTASRASSYASSHTLSTVPQKRPVPRKLVVSDSEDEGGPVRRPTSHTRARDSERDEQMTVRQRVRRLHRTQMPYVLVETTAAERARRPRMTPRLLATIARQRRQGLAEIRQRRQQPRAAPQLETRFDSGSDYQSDGGMSSSSSAMSVDLSSGNEDEVEDLPAEVLVSGRVASSTADTGAEPQARRCDYCSTTITPEAPRVSCGVCAMCYHAACYAKVLARTGLDDPNGQGQGPAGSPAQCVFCERFTGRSIDKILTWRGVTSGSSGNAVLAHVDVAVKWRDESYRHIAWVPLVWLLAVHPQARLKSVKMRIAAGVQAPPLESTFDACFLEPALIVQRLENSASERRARRDALRDAEASVEGDAQSLYVDCRRVRVGWRGQDISEATWETPPAPFPGPEARAEYARWVDAYEGWRRLQMVSSADRDRLAVGRAAGTFSEMRSQPAYLVGGTMFPHQMEGANWLFYQWSRRQSAILADDPGLGKTIQTIAFLALVYHSTLPADLRGDAAAASNLGTFPFLVVVPATVVDNWAAEFAKWAPFLVVSVLSARAASREVQLEHTIFRKALHNRTSLRCHVVLASYEAVVNPAGIARLKNANFEWQAIVLDEGHRLKNEHSKTFRELERFHTRQRVILTGTPLQNSLHELFSLVGFVVPHARGSMQRLEARFRVDDPRSVDEVRGLIRPYMLRRTKDQVTMLMPPRYEIIVPVSMSKLQRELYRATLTRNVALLSRIADALHRHTAIATATAANNATAANSKTRPVGSLQNVLMEVRKILSHPYLLNGVEPAFASLAEEHRQLVGACAKLQLFDALLPELRARGHRMLVFSQFKDTLTILEDYLRTTDVCYNRIDGDTPQQQRQTQINAFNAPDSDADVFLSTTRTGGLGVNLTTADVVIIYDCDFNPHTDMQAMARAHRIGQQKPVLVLKFVTENSVEERILAAATRKLALDHIVIQSMGNGDNDTYQQKQQQQPTDSVVEQALRSDACQLFDKSAEADADARAIHYDSTRVKKLLDQCADALAEETRVARREHENANKKDACDKGPKTSAAFSFARMWTLDRDGRVDEVDPSKVSDPETAQDAGIDVWSSVLDMAKASDTADQNADAAAGELVGDGTDAGSRQLRARKTKINYAIDGSNAEPSADSGDVGNSEPTQVEDAEFVLSPEDEHSEDEGSDMAIDVVTPAETIAETPVTVDPAGTARILHQAPALPGWSERGVVTVTPEVLQEIVVCHVSDLLRVYDDHSINTRPEEIASVNQLVTAEFISLHSYFKTAAALAVQRLALPDIFFKMPTNVCLPPNVPVPMQPSTAPCFLCGNVHKRDFCSFILHPAFVSTVHKIRAISGYWKSEVYWHFLHWYTVQIMWFVAAHPRGVPFERFIDPRKHPLLIDAHDMVLYIRSTLADQRRAQQQQSRKLLDRRDMSEDTDVVTVDKPVSKPQNQRVDSTSAQSAKQTALETTAPAHSDPRAELFADVIGYNYPTIYAPSLPAAKPEWSRLDSPLSEASAHSVVGRFLESAGVTNVDLMNETNPAQLKKVLNLLYI